MKLTADKVKRLTEAGTHSDGGGLYLQIKPSGSKSWIYRYQINKQRRWMGLGGFPEISLANARKARDQQRLMVKTGTDPLELKRERKEKVVEQHKQAKALLMTFRRCAEEYIEQHEPAWKSRKHAQQWTNTLTTYAYPIIGDMPADNINIEHILQILKPMWLEKTETATRVRNRIELVLDYASTLQYRSGDNPARWRGNLAHLLAKPTKIKKVKHHTALPYDDLAEFMVKLGAAQGLAAKALTLTILCATRTSETLFATWPEIDLKKKTWVIPASRMKAEKEHRIPLSTAAVALLEALKAEAASDFLFPGMKLGKPLSNMSMTNVLRRMDRGDLTVHGFRSTFRDWIAEKTNYPQRVAETALAHKLKDGAEAAYQRGDLLEKRSQMMHAWADYCLSKKSKVVKLRA